ncbi:Putative sterol carrier protein [Pyrobaculum oguniense TE7]|uniref:Sterol carrier protein n=1 Tax=Pyrobaculum oguniense (strain DSM 13380 / JCM 10595 / TE7) TaxID=698757 RepID=H6QB37_PYROT|nr:Putative sterol carrier protein [Pyrobaculum oguniense TE7]
MPKFPTREWAEAFCQALNESPEYRSAAAKWEGDIIFLATNLPQELGLGERSAMKLLLKHGHCHGVEFYQGADVDKADAPYILEADYKTWLDVISGKQQPIPAMVLGKIKIKKGSFSILAQYVTAALAMIKAAQKVGT